MKNLSLLLSLLFMTFFSLSQGEGSVFTSTGRGVSTTFATDYQALGINPANLGWDKEFKGKTIAFGFLETGFSFDSKIINNPAVSEVRSIPFNLSFDSTKRYNDFTELSYDLQDGARLNADVRLFGVAVTSKRLGGFAFNVTERYSMNMNLSKDVADIMTFGFGAPYFDSLLVESNGNLSNVANNPQNYDSLQQDNSVSIIAGNSSNPKSIPEIFEGTNLKVSWIREFNFGYGVGLIRKEKFGLYVGIGVKYLQGMALLDVSSDGNNLNGFMSYSPSFSNPNNVGLFSVGNARFKIPKAAGRGFGVDLGVNVKLFKRIKIGLAVNDIGSITWSKNTYNVTTSSSLTNFRVAGFYKDSNSISASTGGVTFDSILNSLVDIQQGSFERKVNLPTTMRLGFGIQFGKILEIGGEVIAPLNSNPGNFSSALYSFGGDVKLGFIVLSAGTVFQQNRQTRIPVGILFAPINRTWELGVSTRDIQSLIKRHDVDNPMYSTAFGFLRFRL
tara:strand:- start:39 stop:1544 length:1506 start_codon:yes stop_codon:yes gene_type:complete